MGDNNSHIILPILMENRKEKMSALHKKIFFDSLKFVLWIRSMWDGEAFQLFQADGGGISAHFLLPKPGESCILSALFFRL